jgi:hypothetical protein
MTALQPHSQKEGVNDTLRCSGTFSQTGFWILKYRMAASVS